MRTRADELLVDRGLVESRSRAQALILAGKVFSGERRVAKAGDTLSPDAALEVRGHDHPWVSRGGLKLDHALSHFGLSPVGRICLDIGASTGGFTDVLLAHGAAKVHAVDVGHGQLAWKLRNDPRVVVHERTNARYLTREVIADPVAALVCDASFIGLATVLPAALTLCAPGTWAVALIKPQFEAGPDAVGSKGVVRDPVVHKAVCERIDAWWAALPGWRVLGITESPITGPEGNREFLIAAVVSGVRVAGSLRHDGSPCPAEQSRPAETTPSQAPSARPDRSADDQARPVSGRTRTPSSPTPQPR
jgi:23S rRNA (cytidine1920-2'-O)/16S rRNA (cytidine1409-2'-O)-methyltransferase